MRKYDSQFPQSLNPFPSNHRVAKYGRPIWSRIYFSFLPQLILTFFKTPRFFEIASSLEPSSCFSFSTGRFSRNFTFLCIAPLHFDCLPLSSKFNAIPLNPLFCKIWPVNNRRGPKTAGGVVVPLRVDPEWDTSKVSIF